MLYLLLIACSTSSGPASPESPAGNSLAALSQAGEAASKLEAVGGALASKARAQLDGQNPEAPGSLREEMERIGEEVKAIRENLQEAAEALELPKKPR
jgi:phosphate uptake regulator